MTLQCGFFNAISGDRTYDAIQMSSLFNGIITDGIFSGIGTSLKVTTPSLLNVNVGIGRAWFNNTWTYNDAVLPLTLDAADLVLPRIDAIILEIDSNTGVRANSIKILKGTPATVPVNPTLITSALKNQYALAYCRVNANATVITTLTDMVGTVGTPYIASAIDNFLAKATVAEIVGGTVDNKYISPKNLHDAVVYPDIDPVVAGANAKIISNGTDWVAQVDNGWIQETHAWAQSAIDGPTGVIQITGDVTQLLQPGMRLKYTQSQALTAYCPMDANSNSAIGSFTMADTAMTYTAGKYSNAATFNGTTSRINITDTALMKPTGAFTIGMWVKSSTLAQQGLFQSFSANTNWAGITMLINTSGKLQVTIAANTGTTSGMDWVVIAGQTTITDGFWHFVVLTLRNNYAQIYVDGQLEAGDYSVTPAYGASNNVRIGCQNNVATDTNFLNGQIDDYFLINGYALDQETILSRYTASALGSGNMSISKKAIVTRVGSFSGTVTFITAYHGTDSELTTGTITNTYYSNSKMPFGFNSNPEKWQVLHASYFQCVKSTPALGSWYGGSQFTSGTIRPSISIPIGSWIIDYQTCMYTAWTTGVSGNTFNLRVTLSTSETTESHRQFSVGFSGIVMNTSVFQTKISVRSGANKLLLLAKTLFTLNIATINYDPTVQTPTSLAIGDVTAGLVPTRIIATCAYL